MSKKAIYWCPSSELEGTWRKWCRSSLSLVRVEGSVIFISLNSTHRHSLITTKASLFLACSWLMIHEFVPKKHVWHTIHRNRLIHHTTSTQQLFLSEPSSRSRTYLNQKLPKWQLWSTYSHNMITLGLLLLPLIQWDLTLWWSTV